VWWKKYHKQLVLTTIQCLSTARHGAKARLSNYTGFEMFLLPKLAGLDDEVVYVPLPDFTLQDAQSMVKSLGSLVSGAACSERLEGRREGDMPLNEQLSQME
jgi:hypothetical protein